MARVPAPDVRLALVERAALLLAGRETVTLRSLVEGTGVSTMAVYTHFGGMPGLWRAVRQEGFTRLGRQLAAVESTGDPIRDLVALGGAYVGNALTDPALYQAMFDTAVTLDDPAAAGQTFQVLLSATVRARDEGRFRQTCDPAAVATRFWALGHGLTMLVLSGVLPREVLDAHVPATAAALFIDAGDTPARCRRSVAAGWSSPFSPVADQGAADHLAR